ncbi:MAG: hypothetical protein MK052_02780 [Alphaproteobacteria bacterium]|nr:hypothetical protein [Alphaproteobacteria bacterium]
MRTLKLQASTNGSKNDGYSINMNGKDRLLDSAGKKLKDFPDSNGEFTSKNDATLVLDGLDSSASVLTVSGVGAWNTTKTLVVKGDAEALDGKDLVINNIVHAKVDLAHHNGGLTKTDVNVTVDGVKRADIDTGKGDDVVEVGILTNNATWSRNFDINTRDGNDTIILRDASADSYSDAGLIESGRHSSVEVNSGRGDDVVIVNTQLENASIKAGRGDDRIEINAEVSGEFEIKAGRGDDHVTMYADAELANGADVSLGRGNDTFEGGNAADTVSGGRGDDLFVYNSFEAAAGDVVRGGRGEDTVQLHGTVADYSVAAEANGWFDFTITSLDAHIEVRNVELFRFDNGTDATDDDIVMTLQEVLDYNAAISVSASTDFTDTSLEVSVDLA